MSDSPSLHRRPYTPISAELAMQDLVEMAAVHNTIFCVDAEGFTDPQRTDRHRAAVRRGIYSTVRYAFAGAGVKWQGCHVEDRGDGVLVLLGPEVPKETLVTRLMWELVAVLEEINHLHCPQAQIRLRAALHVGEVRHDPYGVVGAAVNLAFRLLESTQLKHALAGSEGPLALIVSQPVFDDVIADNPASARRSFRQIRVSAKQTTTTAWIRLFDSPPPPPPSPESSAATSASPYDSSAKPKAS